MAACPVRIPIPVRRLPIHRVEESSSSALRGLCLSRSLPGCEYCHGLGWFSGEPCGCVYRAVFRSVMSMYFLIGDYPALSKGHRIPSLHPHYATADGPRRESSRRAFHAVFATGRKGEEFRVDVEIVARRVLDEREYSVFQQHVLRGLQWMECVRRIPGLIRGTFFHAVYRVQEKLGREFMSMKPYHLYPISDYFAS